MTIEDLKRMNINELKALAFDSKVELERIQGNLNILVNLIQEKAIAPKYEKVKPVQEPEAQPDAPASVQESEVTNEQA